MASSGPTSLPPTTIHTSQPISQSAASDFLAAYINRAAADPSLQPTSFLTQEGPKSRNAGGTKSSIETALGYVQGGLAGVFFDKNEDLQAFEAQMKGKRKREGKWFEEEIAAFTGKKKGGRRESGGGGKWGGAWNGSGSGSGKRKWEEKGKEVGGWEDKQVFEAQQQVEEGRGDDEVGGVVDDEVVEVGEDGMPPKIDKEERKRKKKEKRKAEKRAKATED